MTELGNKYYLNLKKDKFCPDLDVKISKHMAKLAYKERMCYSPSYLKPATLIKDTRIEEGIYSLCKGLKYTPYEQALYDVCNDFNIDIKIIHINTKESCDNIYRILTTNTSSNCNMLYSLSVREHLKNNCNNYTLTIKEEDCIFAYKALLKEVPSCNLTYTDYKNLIAIDYTPKCISNIYKNSFKLSPSNPECIFDFNNNKISLTKDLCFTKILSEKIDNPERCLKEELKYYDKT